jgi:hypothetical protein
VDLGAVAEVLLGLVYRDIRSVWWVSMASVL